MLSVLLAAALLQDPPRPLLERVAFPADAEAKRLATRDPAYAKALAALLDRRHWTESIARVEKMLYAFPADLKVAVRLVEWDDDRHAETGWDDNEARLMVIELNLKAIAKSERMIEEFRIENERRKAKREAPLAWDARPPDLSSIVPHELTHVLQGGLDTPDWFFEGLAYWVGGSPAPWETFISREKDVKPVDVEAGTPEAGFGRGMLFFMWMEQTAGAPKVAALAKAVYADGLEIAAAAEKVLGKPLDALKKDEQAWTKAFAEKNRPRTP